MQREPIEMPQEKEELRANMGGRPAGEHLHRWALGKVFREDLGMRRDAEILHHVASECETCWECLESVAEQRRIQDSRESGSLVGRALHRLLVTHPARENAEEMLETLMPKHRVAALEARESGFGFVRLVLEESIAASEIPDGYDVGRFNRALGLLHMLPPEALGRIARADISAIALGHLAVVTFYGGESEEARASLGQAEETLDAGSGDLEIQALVLELEGHHLISESEPDEALKRLEKAEALLGDLVPETRPGLGQLQDGSFF